ncbi:probable serine hydrolase isoform X1 [Drosophila nasuta]|uniref:probable serine hydrolase isoform X1 n=1 Tax=Drosophila nasuta TaxID=42062 RepID=UPI00295E7900|nr:probable serine hydrolase isoform X1 [Drosophila nasuta]XP_060663954.1 probable serine hydrolase isoform X1 [Drosophila nasuta]
MEFEDIEIAVPWGQLSCRWYGNRQVRPLLTVHGLLDNLGTFARLLPLLPQHLGVLCIEQPGHGRSSPYPDGMQYSLEDWVSVIRRVVLHFKWKRVSLMGHSLGSVVCNLYVALHPGDHVDMLIAIDMLNIRLKSNEYYIKVLVKSVESMLRPPRAVQLLTAEQLQKMRWPTAPLVSEADAQDLLDRCLVPAAQESNKFYLSRDLRPSHITTYTIEYNITLELYKRIKNVPYLVIKADGSNLLNDENIPVLDILRANNPNFEYHLAKGSHHAHIENPEQLAAWIVPFINKYRPPSRWEDPGHTTNSKL